MKEKIIKAYVNRLTKNDIIMFAKSNNIILENSELDFIYNSIKNDYEKILEDPIGALSLAKTKLKPKTYDKIYELYTIYYPKLYH